MVYLQEKAEERVDEVVLEVDVNACGAGLLALAVGAVTEAAEGAETAVNEALAKGVRRVLEGPADHKVDSIREERPRGVGLPDALENEMASVIEVSLDRSRNGKERNS